MDLTAYLLIALKGSVALLIFAVGLDSRLRDLSYLTRRPGVMLRSLLAMYVVVPLLALTAVRLLQLPWNSRSWCWRFLPAHPCCHAN